MAPRPRVLVTLMGDIDKDAARIKYGFLVKALERQLPVVAVHDTTLKGVERLLNALWVFHPNREIWRQRFYKNPAAFRARSRGAAALVRRFRGKADVVFQINTMFDARWRDAPLPSVIYTDYTVALSAKRKDAGRFPFTAGQYRRWAELERQAFERADRVMTRGRFVCDSLIDDYGLDSARLSPIGGGLNLAALPDQASPLDGDTKTALFVGKDFYRKGGDLLLEAFGRVRSRVPGARLLFLTDGSIPSGHPLEGVELVAPTWDRSRILELYRQADLFVLPSRLETWGDVLIEAMAHGLPCVGVSGEAMEEIIDHEVTGLVVPAGRVEALAEAMIRLFEDSDLSRRWGRAGRERVESQFTWERAVERLVPALEAAAALS